MRYYVVLCALLCLCLPLQPSQAGNPVSAVAEQSPNALPPVLLTPDLSVEEFNRRLDARDVQECLLVTADFPRDQVQLHGIVDRAAKFTWEDQVFQGRVSSVFLLEQSGKSLVRVFVRIDNRKAQGKWILPKHAQGTLALAE